MIQWYNVSTVSLDGHGMSDWWENFEVFRLCVIFLGNEDGIKVYRSGKPLKGYAIYCTTDTIIIKWGYHVSKNILLKFDFGF